MKITELVIYVKVNWSAII